MWAFPTSFQHLATALRDLSLIPSIITVFLLCVGYCILWIIYCRTLHPLARVPVYRMYIGDLEVAQRALHEKYGPLIRIAPNEVMSSDPSAIPLIYTTHNALPKTSWYTSFSTDGISEHADLFTETDEVKHTRYRKVVQPAYQMSSILKNEGMMDECTTMLLQKLDEFAMRNKDVDLMHWLELYTHDVIGHVIFGRSFGFLESGTDVGSFIESVASAMPLVHFIAVAPTYLRKPILYGAMALPTTLKCFKAVRHMAEQGKQQVSVRMHDSYEENINRPDIMSQLLSRTQNGKTWFTDKEVTLESWTSLMVGADPVAVHLCAVLYYLMRHPAYLFKATQEIRHVDAQNLLSNPITFAEATKHLPYVSTCIKEASRLFPSTGASMPRVAPAQGITLSGFYIPAGYHVGVSPPVIQHDKGLFGEDAGHFRPERWLESAERNRAMDKGMVVYGAGTRICAGKNIALAEGHKLVPELLRRFDMQRAHDRPWKTRNAGFIKQKDVIVKLASVRSGGGVA
ncbi:pisatin demethylase [Decorospora gaudefroyi]|uniref:Pisatin demethylase n=1 Tax=Decorospora gaudefroyi TaxID=184978 RepID=A0A6A5KHM8_9PLEO|nr:pisatin demethylase [Decorospora gaudefroyi]